MGKAMMMYAVLCCDDVLSHAILCFEFGMQGRAFGESEVFQSARCSGTLSNMLFWFTLAIEESGLCWNVVRQMCVVDGRSMCSWEQLWLLEASRLSLYRFYTIANRWKEHAQRLEHLWLSNACLSTIRNVNVFVFYSYKLFIVICPHSSHTLAAGCVEAKSQRCDFGRCSVWICLFQTRSDCTVLFLCCRVVWTFIVLCQEQCFHRTIAMSETRAR